MYNLYSSLSLTHSLSQSNILRSHLDGCIQIKSFLTGEAEIRIGLNEDLHLSFKEKRRGYGGVVLDDINFHECANLELFDTERIISINAPDGELRGGVVKGRQALIRC